MDAVTKFPNWYKIQPSLLGSNYHRYQLLKGSTSECLLVYVKLPCNGMDGCDACAGPHRKKNKQCSKNLLREPYILSPTDNEGGIYLFELHTGFQQPGRWQIESWRRHPNNRVAIASLVRL
jgi:hypothetical protein